MRRLGQKPTKHFAGLEDLPEYSETTDRGYGVYTHRDVNGYQFGVFVGDPVEGLLASGYRSTPEIARSSASGYVTDMLSGKRMRSRNQGRDWVSN